MHEGPAQENVSADTAAVAALTLEVAEIKNKIHKLEKTAGDHLNKIESLAGQCYQDNKQVLEDISEVADGMRNIQTNYQALAIRVEAQVQEIELLKRQNMRLEGIVRGQATTMGGLNERMGYLQAFFNEVQEPQKPILGSPKELLTSMRKQKEATMNLIVPEGHVTSTHTYDYQDQPTTIPQPEDSK